MSGLLRKVALSLASLTIALGLVEGAFRLLGFEPIFDVYSRPELFWKADPLLGWSLEPKSRDVFRGPRPFPIEFEEVVRINSLGFRGPELHQVGPDGARVLVLGDSVVAGFEVSEEKHFVSLIEARVSAQLARPVQVINAGVRGYGTDQTLLLFNQMGPRLKPDLVVFVYSANDPEDNMTLHRPRRPFGKPAFVLRQNGALELVGSPVPEYPFCSSYRLSEEFEIIRDDALPSRVFCWLETTLSDHSAFFSFIATRLRNIPHVIYSLHRLGEEDRATERPSKARPSEVITSALLAELAQRVRKQNAAFILGINENELQRLDRNRLEIDAGEILVLDGVREGRDPATFTFRRDGHLNAAGHHRLADVLTPAVVTVLTRRGKDSARAGQDVSAFPTSEARER